LKKNLGATAQNIATPNFSVCASARARLRSYSWQHRVSNAQRK